MSRRTYRPAKGRRTYRRKRTFQKAVKAVIKKTIETKEKFYPNTAVGGGGMSFYSIGYGGASSITTLCSGITQGVAGNQRVGRSIFLRGIYIWFPIGPGDSQNYVRIIVARPKGGSVNASTNVATAAIDLLSGATSSGTQFLNPIDTDKYQVYYDKCVFVHKQPLDGNSSTTVEPIKWIRKYIKINRKIEYLDDTSSNCVEDIWMYGISDSSAVTHPGAIAGFVKLYYQDA